MRGAQGDYINPKYLPEAMILQQYHHLRQDEVEALLKHWSQRQAAGKAPFRFRKTGKAARQKKRAMEGSDSDADTRPNEEEADLQGDNGCQAQGTGPLQPGGNSDRSEQSLRNTAENTNGVGWLLKQGE